MTAAEIVAWGDAVGTTSRGSALTKTLPLADIASAGTVALTNLVALAQAVADSLSPIA
jgi:hypothetical protein